MNASEESTSAAAETALAASTAAPSVTAAPAATEATSHDPLESQAVVIGAGPAGLIAAEVLSQAGVPVHLFDAMPTAGRKLLLAGKGGLNLTHSEPLSRQLDRYAERAESLAPHLTAFGPDQVREWARGLGIDTFVGSSGRVFPKDMKAAPLLRAWLHRLRHPVEPGAAVRFHMRHRWTGWDERGALTFESQQGPMAIRARMLVLALGGASWPRLGSNGGWVPLLQARGVDVAPLVPSNCGFDVGTAARSGWSEHFASRFAGQPFKSVAISAESGQRLRFRQKGEFVATATGVEGSLIYAASPLLRAEIAANGSATFELDLLPDRTLEQVRAEVAHPRGARSLSSHLKSRLSLGGIKSAILHELLGKADFADPDKLSAAIKALPVRLTAARPVAEAISSAGGVRFESLTEGLMLRDLPDVFCAGEMLDWEAPTGGYLLTACLASGRAAGKAALARLLSAG
ncbi:MAG: TIGR03862 family flavoprotein [Burkholderiales bacterium]